MEVTGRFDSASLSLDGKLRITFEISDKDKALQEIDAIKDVDKLTIAAKKQRAKRSLDANAYFWLLCDRMAKRLNSDKWTIYLLQLSKYGVFADLAVDPEAVPLLKSKFRYVETLAASDEVMRVRCYFGSSTYNTQEMSDLINGTVSDANGLGVDTMTPDEINHMLAAWKASGLDTNGY